MMEYWNIGISKIQVLGIGNWVLTPPTSPAYKSKSLSHLNILRNLWKLDIRIMEYWNLLLVSQSLSMSLESDLSLSQGRLGY